MLRGGLRFWYTSHPVLLRAHRGWPWLRRSLLSVLLGGWLRLLLLLLVGCRRCVRCPGGVPSPAPARRSVPPCGSGLGVPVVRAAFWRRGHLPEVVGLLWRWLSLLLRRRLRRLLVPRFGWRLEVALLLLLLRLRRRRRLRLRWLCLSWLWLWLALLLLLRGWLVLLLLWLVLLLWLLVLTVGLLLRRCRWCRWCCRGWPLCKCRR